jgi:hypothetical protein
MKDPKYCDFYGCYRSKNEENALTAIVVGEQSKDIVACNYHHEMLEVMDPSLYSIGLTYIGEPEIRLHPAVPASPPA